MDGFNDIKMLDGFDYVEMLPDSFYELFNGKDCISGTNFSYINKQIDILKSKENISDEDKNSLTKYYSEIKKTKDGIRKPKTCWEFVHKGKCIHTNCNDENHGIIISNRWHPEKEERLYLKNKKNKE